MCMAAAHDFTGLMVTRALMGGFEATVSPAFIACVQIWWRRREQTWRNTVWLLSSSVAGMVSRTKSNPCALLSSDRAPGGVRSGPHPQRHQAVPGHFHLPRRYHARTGPPSMVDVSRRCEDRQIPLSARKGDCGGATAIEQYWDEDTVSGPTSFMEYTEVQRMEVVPG